MDDAFRKQNRFESVSSLNHSIANLKSSHATLEVTSKAFKESIAKEKEIFNQLVAMELSPAPTENTKNTEKVALNSSTETFLETEVSVKSANPETQDEGEQAGIEGIMTTEKTPIVHSE